MRTKFYYTIRELSNHAAELFALKAIGGMLVGGDPYKVPQPGYCHDWDCHGGTAWLHQHLGMFRPPPCLPGVGWGPDGV